ncbi:PhoH family protein [Vibrio phage ICP1_2006_E]|nr:putative ATPase [Vibrio phage JSF5]AXQ70832.1 PhoH family protein [Vibrio phage ICP1_2006_E]HAS2540025.1 PhoH family protein [Vibrio cholerae]
MPKHRHANRNAQQDRSGFGKVKGRNENKVMQGQRQIAEEYVTDNQDYRLDWFQPTEEQKDIIYSMCVNDLTSVQAPSGCGKSTTVIWQGLNDLKRGVYKTIIFVKAPDESGDDQIGYLKGEAESKLEPHFESMRGIFHQFMSSEKLRMEERRGRIQFKIPNFLKGATLDNALIIFDESQSNTPPTIKLVTERAGLDSKVVLLGDKSQRYSVKKRADGFTHFNKMITYVDDEGNRVSKEPTMGYIELSTSGNMRSDLSRRITELYEENQDW